MKVDVTGCDPYIIPRKAEADEAASEAQAADDKAKKAMLDAAKIAEELRYEQENAQTLERERKEMEIRAHDLQVQLDDAEQVRLIIITLKELHSIGILKYRDS